MAGENAIHCALFYLIAEIIELRICQLIEMEPTDEGIDFLSAESQPDIFQNVCHAGMRTAAEYDQTGRRVKDKALFMGKAVRIVGFVFSDIEVVALGNRGIICRTVGDQPYAAGDFMDSGNIPDAVLKLLEKAFFEPFFFFFYSMAPSFRPKQFSQLPSLTRNGAVSFREKKASIPSE